jgi:Zn finger protein HypA/HybF involved in hydrogenase expression
MGKKNQIISHTGSHKKVVINLEHAEKVLNPDTLRQLNQILIELNHAQETCFRCGKVVRLDKGLCEWCSEYQNNRGDLYDEEKLKSNAKE